MSKPTQVRSIALDENPATAYMHACGNTMTLMNTDGLAACFVVSASNNIRACILTARSTMSTYFLSPEDAIHTLAAFPEWDPTDQVEVEAELHRIHDFVIEWEQDLRDEAEHE